MDARKGWFTPHGGESEEAFGSVAGQRQTLRTKTRKLPSACPHCGWKGEFSWDGGNYVVCGYCMSKVQFEEVTMTYCPICQCEVEAKLDKDGYLACSDCHNVIPLKGEKHDWVVQDEVPVLINKEGVVGMTGWICPVCGSGVSPHKDVCPCRMITITGVDPFPSGLGEMTWTTPYEHETTDGA